MRVACYGEDGTFEGDDLEVLADQFVAHVRAEHQTQYPEASLRTFVRNFVEAEERLTGTTERLDEIGEISVHPVSADRIDDWLRGARIGSPQDELSACGKPTTHGT